MEYAEAVDNFEDALRGDEFVDEEMLMALEDSSDFLPWRIVRLIMDKTDTACNTYREAVKAYRLEARRQVYKIAA